MTFGKIQSVELGSVFNQGGPVKFLRYLLKKSYCNFFPDRKQEVGLMVDEVFNKLQLHFSNNNKEEIDTVATKLFNTVFMGGDDSFWFNERYKKYKSITKPQNELENLVPLIKGKSILDFGSGMGFLSFWLDKLGYTLYSTDVMECQNNDFENIEFVTMKYPDSIPYEDDSIDTVIIKTVLHHINPEYIDTVVKELHRVSKRVIILEDVYDINPGQLDPELRQTEVHQRFFSLSKKERRDCCILNDYYGNAIAQGITKMNFPFEFKSVDEWSKLFNENGYETTLIKVLGFSKYNLHGFFQVIMVFDR